MTGRLGSLCIFAAIWLLVKMEFGTLKFKIMTDLDLQKPNRRVFVAVYSVR